MGGGLGGGVARGGPAGGLSGGAPVDPFFRNFDKQNTGKIRKEDVPEWMRERFFEMLDTNRDGVVDHDEFTANYSKLWETPSSRRSAPTARTGGRSDSAGRGEGTGRAASGGGRGEGVGRGEGDGRPGAGAGVRGAADRDTRDERMKQLENELNDLRKTLEDLKGKDRSSGIKP